MFIYIFDIAHVLFLPPPPPSALRPPPNFRNSPETHAKVKQKKIFIKKNLKSVKIPKFDKFSCIFRKFSSSPANFSSSIVRCA